MDKPVALDLCCGLGGWSRGLQKAGWDVIGVDTEPWPNPYLHKFIQRDVRELHGSDFPGVRLVVASPPCQEFSYRSFPFKRCRYLRDNVPPDKSIWDACVRIAAEIGCPLVLENVRGAQGLTKGIPHPEWFMGRAKWNYGPFYFWGDDPILTFPGKRPQKGFGRAKDLENPSDPWGGFGGSSYQSRSNCGPLNAKRGSLVGAEKHMAENFRNSHGVSGSSARAEWSAKAAMIPEELAEWIGKVYHPDGI